MLRVRGQLVIGHGDWTVKHFRFDGLRPTADSARCTRAVGKDATRMQLLDYAEAFL
jgi:hypothetical protein